jgi:ATP-binding cassette, subfamily B, bacterial
MTRAFRALIVLICGVLACLLAAPAPAGAGGPRVTIDRAFGTSSGSIGVVWHAERGGVYTVWAGGTYCGGGTKVASGSYAGSASVTTGVPSSRGWIRICVTDEAGRTGSDAIAGRKPLVAVTGDGDRADREALLLALAALLMLGVALLVLRKLRRDHEGRVTRQPEARTVAAPRLYTDFALYARLLREARPYWTHIGVIFLLSLLATPIALLTPLPLKLAVDNVLGDDPLPGFIDAVLPANATSEQALLIVTVGLVLAITLVRQAHELSLSLLRTLTSERLLLRFRGRLFGQAQRLSLAYHDTRGTSDAVYRIQYDATAIQRVAVEGVIPLLASLLTLFAMIYVTALLDPVLALVALGVCPLLIAVTAWYRTRVRRRYKEVKRLESGALSVVQEVFGALRVVKAFGQEDREAARYVGSAQAGMRARLRVALMEGLLGLCVGLTIAAGTGTVLYVGVRHVQDGTLSLGSLLLIMGYLTQLYEPLRTLSKKAATLQSALVSAERAYTLLDEEPDVPEGTGARPLKRATGKIGFADVAFAYPGGEPVLHDITFSVEPGTKVGIAGATGAGKSTLVALLSRFYDPTRGRILLDGVDLRDYRLVDLRNQFAIVLQEPVLFSTTIRENISYARPEATDEDIAAAARAANAHDFIAALPDGYDTLVGERGMRLSGGERQRIGLARAFLKDAPILILDEPTSAVDVKTEAGIMDTMQRLMKGRTSFMIAHRLSTLENCDIRLELEHGRISADPEQPSRRVEDRRAASGESHPAAAAWMAASGRGRPTGVEPIVVKKRTAAFRLRGVPLPGAAVVAKRRPLAEAVEERQMYERVLAHVAAPTAAYYGFLRDPDDFCWVFLEDVGDDAYSPESATHSMLAAQYLASLHTASEVPRGLLHDRGPGHYLRHLRSARELIRANVGNPALSGDDVRTLERIDIDCGVIESCWDDIEEFCERMAPGLVHGDFVYKNVRVQRTNGHVRMVPFDWETAGWGVPAADLIALDDVALQVYRSAVIAHWPAASFVELRRLREVGRLFRLVASVSWATKELPYEWVNRPMKKLRRYEPELARVASLGRR